MVRIIFLLPLLLIVAIVDSKDHGHDSPKTPSQPQAVGYDNAGLNSMIMNLINNRINKQLANQAVRSITNPKTVRSSPYGKSSNTSHGVETKYSEVEAKVSDLAASPNNLLSKSAAFASKFAHIKSDGHESLPLPTVTTEEPTDETTSEEPIPTETSETTSEEPLPSENTSEEPMPSETTSEEPEETTSEEDNTPDNSILDVPTFKPYVYTSTVSPQFGFPSKRVKTRAARNNYDDEEEEDAEHDENEEDTSETPIEQETNNDHNRYVKLTDVMKLLKLKGTQHVQKQKKTVNENLATLLDALNRASIKVKDNGRRTIKTAKRSRTIINEEDHKGPTEEQRNLRSLNEEIDKLIASKSQKTTTQEPPTTQPKKVRSGADLSPIMAMISSLTEKE